MGILKNLKTWYECKKSGRMDEYKQYKEMIDYKEKDIKRFEGYIEDCKTRLEKLRSRGYVENSKEIIDTKNDLQRWIYCLDETKAEIEFLRPNFKEDICYREIKTREPFIQDLKNANVDKLGLVFHGTPVYFAKEILETGKITSSADRYDGYIKSTDRKGEISVSDIDSLSRTLTFFSALGAHVHCLPSGCIFALHPKDDKDFNKGQSLMSSVDFKKNPEQLYGIFTTPENIPYVKSWLEKAGLDSNLAYDFDGFVQAVSKSSKALESNNKLDNSLKVSNEVIQEIENRSHSEQNNQQLSTDENSKTSEIEDVERDNEVK